MFVNVKNPNAANNTCVFCSLRIALERYRDQIEDLESKTWRWYTQHHNNIVLTHCITIHCRGKNIFERRLWLFVPYVWPVRSIRYYNYLNNSYMYRFQRRNILLLKTGKYWKQESTAVFGASDQLRDPPQSVPARSTQSICQDFQRFTAAGADLKKAKQYCTTTLLSWDTTHQCKLQVTSTIDDTYVHVYTYM